MTIESDLNFYAEPIVDNVCPLCGEGWPERHEWITEAMVVKLMYVHSSVTRQMLTARQARQILKAALLASDHA